MCLSKHQGGLGIKNIVHFNQALLGKWRWRLISGGEDLWCKVLKSNYGKESCGKFCRRSYRESMWWRDSGLTCGENVGLITSVGGKLGMEMPWNSGTIFGSGIYA